MLGVLSFHRDILLPRVPLLQRLVDHLAPVLTGMTVHKAVNCIKQIGIERHADLDATHATNGSTFSPITYHTLSERFGAADRRGRTGLKVSRLLISLGQAAANRTYEKSSEKGKHRVRPESYAEDRENVDPHLFGRSTLFRHHVDAG